MSPIRPALDILLYHDVAPTLKDATRRGNPRFTTTRERLTHHLDHLQECGYTFINLGKWLRMGLTGRIKAGSCVALSFDGPHIGWFETVVPMLRERGLPATFFVTTGWVGSHHPYPESRLLGWDDVRTLESSLVHFDFGCHSMWHTVLERRSDESRKQFFQRLDLEIVTSTAALREEMRSEPVGFAPPKGRGDRTMIRPFIQRAGLRSIRWAGPLRHNGCFTDPLLLNISYCDQTDFSDDDLQAALRSARRRRMFARLRNLIRRQ